MALLALLYPPYGFEMGWFSYPNQRQLRWEVAIKLFRVLVEASDMEIRFYDSERNLDHCSMMVELTCIEQNPRAINSSSSSSVHPLENHQKSTPLKPLYMLHVWNIRILAIFLS